jgi:hypothetical protein
MNTILILLLAVVGVLGFFLLLMIRDTIRRKGRWGINPNQVRCPRCGQEMPKIRVPVSLNQASWGGGTCAKCGCEMDKWGVEIRP